MTDVNLSGKHQDQVDPFLYVPKKISIVTVTYNALEELQKTLVSVQSQTHQDFEHIIVDGGSRDGTKEFLLEASDCIAKWICEPDHGIYDAMNKGAALAEGEWIVFMNAGDTFYAPTSLADAALYLDDSADVVYGGVEVVTTDRYQTRRWHSPAKDLSCLWREVPACHQSILIRRELQVTYGFNSSMQWCADHDLLVRLYMGRYRFRAIPVTVARFDGASGERRDNLIYTRERWRISQYLAPATKRHSYFLYEYAMVLFRQHVLLKIRNRLPDEWVKGLRRLRGTG